MNHYVIILSIALTLFGFCAAAQTEWFGCYDGIGSEQGEKPNFTIIMSNQDTLALCGSTEKRKDYFNFEAYEFDIFDAHTGESLLTYGALESCVVSATRDSITFTRIKRMPAGKEWSWISKPIAVQRIVVKDHDLIVEQSKSIVPNVEISEQELEDFMSAIAVLKDKGELINPYEIIGRLYVTAISGNEEAVKLLLGFRNEFNCTVDGAVAETWIEFVELYKSIN